MPNLYKTTDWWQNFDERFSVEKPLKNGNYQIALVQIAIVTASIVKTDEDNLSYAYTKNQQLLSIVC